MEIKDRLPTRDLQRMLYLGRTYGRLRDPESLEEAATYLAVVGTYTPEGASLRIWWEEGTRNVVLDTPANDLAMSDLEQRAWELKDREDFIDMMDKTLVIPPGIFPEKLA